MYKFTNGIIAYDEETAKGLIKAGYKLIEDKKISKPKKEKNIMYRIVEAEAGGEDAVGKMLVANVIINRYNDKFNS